MQEFALYLMKYLGMTVSEMRLFGGITTSFQLVAMFLTANMTPSCFTASRQNIPSIESKKIVRNPEDRPKYAKRWMGKLPASVTRMENQCLWRARHKRRLQMFGN